MTGTISTVEGSGRALRSPALVAGVGLLVMAVLGGWANFAALETLVTDGDAARTARDVLAAEGTFRLAAAAMIVVAILDVIVAWALLEFFGPANRPVARLAAWMRVAYAAVLAVGVSQLLGAVGLLTDPAYLATFGTDELQAEALLRIGAFHDMWTAGLVLFGVHLLLLGHLAYRSEYVPRLLGVLLAVSGACYLVDGVVAFLAPAASAGVAAFTVWGELLEILLLVWLLVRGRKVVVNAPPAPGH